MMTRNLAYDIMRLVAILLVATQHAWSMLGLDTPEHGLVCFAYRSIVDCGVPLFVLISGALLLSESPTSLSQFFRKRLSRVLIPFLIWATVVYILSALTHQYADIYSVKDALINFVPYLFANQINNFHWFVHMILALYILTPILQRALKDESHTTWEYLLGIWIVGLIGKQIFPQIYLWQYTSSLFTYLGLYIFGGYWAHFHANNLKSKHTLAFACLPVLLYVLNVALQTKFSCLTTLTAASLFMLLSCTHSLSVSSSGAKVCVAISRYSYLIYLTHIPLIRAIYMGMDKVGGIPTQITTMAPIIVAIVVVTLISLCCLVLDHIPGRFKHYVGVA